MASFEDDGADVEFGDFLLEAVDESCRTPSVSYAKELMTTPGRNFRKPSIVGDAV